MWLHTTKGSSIMNELMNNQIPTMSSVEIAKLTGKLHKHVVRDIDVMKAKLEAEVPGPNLGRVIKTSTYKDANDNDRRCYHLDKEMTVTLVSGYDVVLRYRIVKRWQELEERGRFNPNAKPIWLEPIVRSIMTVIEHNHEQTDNRFSEIDDAISKLREDVIPCNVPSDYSTHDGFLANVKHPDNPKLTGHHVGPSVSRSFNKRRGYISEKMKLPPIDVIQHHRITPAYHDKVNQAAWKAALNRYGY